MFFKHKNRLANSPWLLGQVDKAAVQFFNTFGFLKIPGFFTEEIREISNEFDSMMKEKFGDTSAERNYLYPQFIDNSRKLSELLTLPKLSTLIGALMGKDFVYKGSDGNIFSASTGWHRDYLIRTKSCKMLVYLEENEENTGALRVIPGTHFVDDAYSNFIGSALTWPEPAHMGGFDEKGVFGTGHSPQQFGQNSLLPQTVVRNSPGDIIIFNHNLVHCTNASAVPRRRRLMGLHFCVNPKTALKEMDEETQNEIRTLSLVEMDNFKLPKMFGKFVYDHSSPIVQKMIEPLKDLHLDTDSTFNGLYQRQSDWSIQFCNRLKGNHHTRHDRVN
jgi:hypothetical protein